MKEYPRITELLDNCARWPYNKDLETELRALLAERDALKAKVPTPVRKLREYKGVTYAGGRWWFKGLSYDKAARVIAIVCSFTDADHAAIYALREQPYEPVETVEDVLREMCDYSRRLENVPKYAARLRAAVAAEGVRDA